MIVDTQLETPDHLELRLVVARIGDLIGRLPGAAADNRFGVERLELDRVGTRLCRDVDKLDPSPN